MKKLLAILLSLTVIGVSMMSLVSCGDSEDDGDAGNDTSANAGDGADASDAADTDATTTDAPDTDEPGTAAPVTEAPETEPPVDPYADYTKLYDDIDMDSISGDPGFEGEGPENVFDDDPSTKWCLVPTAEDGSITIQWAMMSPVTLNGYAFTTANDSSDRNPETWTLSASTSADGEYTVIATVEAGDLPWDFLTDSAIFPIDNPGEYQYYRLHVTENFNDRGLYQFSELILLAAK